MAALRATERLDGLEYLELLGIQGAGYKAAGDVHGISRDGAIAAREALGERVTSSPHSSESPRRVSTSAELALFRTRRAVSGVGNRLMSTTIVREKSIELPDSSYESRLVVHGANMLNAITEEVGVGPVYRMEDITTSGERFANLVRELTRTRSMRRPSGAQRQSSSRVRTGTKAPGRHAPSLRGSAKWYERSCRRARGRSTPSSVITFRNGWIDATSRA